MGADGGCIATQRKFTRIRKTKDNSAEQKKNRDHSKAVHCALSNRVLENPVVACEKGYVFNKEAVVSRLLDKTMPKSLKHVKLSSIIECNFKKTDHSKEKIEDESSGVMICPVTNVEMNGLYTFCLISSCRCVISEKAMIEVPGSSCPACAKEFEESDVIFLNPNEEQAKLNKSRAKIRKAKKKALKTKEPKKRLVTDSTTVPLKIRAVAAPISSVRTSAGARKTLDAGLAMMKKKMGRSSAVKEMFATRKGKVSGETLQFRTAASSTVVNRMFEDE
eukprot:TRINITY_DN377769_c0_g1_i1.p1 TRINITY_DN377769_c0_g1~~TRINITY_DN377769_c0_g1_i1.p1  ORF type:complete len:277 (+),score=83.18 TRINITY_DN377769_c0_g1_i1:105-935(+)